nr:class I SAM-dependent methyltransferase [Micromonospora sp. DSM 115978]
MTNASPSDSATLTSVEMSPQVQAVAVQHLGADPRATFEVADAHAWLSGYDDEPFDLAFVDCRPGKFQDLETLLGLLRVGGLYVGDDLLPQPTWPDDHQRRVGAFLDRLPSVSGLRPVTMAWASGLVVGARTERLR